jgi:hypothetical protein
VARVAGDEVGDANRRLLAAKAVLQRYFEVVTQIAAAARPGLSSSAVAHELAEHFVEDVGKPAGKAEFAGSARAALLKGGMAKAVVSRTLLVVLEDVVGFADVLELLLGVLVAGIAVRVTLHREFAIGLFEIVGTGGPRNAESLVIILLSHARGAFVGGSAAANRPGEEAPGRFAFDRYLNCGADYAEPRFF